MLLCSVTTVSGAVLPFTWPLLSAVFYICKIKPSRLYYTHKSPVPALIYSHKIFCVFAGGCCNTWDKKIALRISPHVKPGMKSSMEGKKAAVCWDAVKEGRKGFRKSV